VPIVSGQCGPGCPQECLSLTSEGEQHAGYRFEAPEGFGEFFHRLQRPLSAPEWGTSLTVNEVAGRTFGINMIRIRGR